MKMVDIDLVSQISVIVSPYTKAIVDEWLKPKLAEILKKRKKDKELYQEV